MATQRLDDLLIEARLDPKGVITGTARMDRAINRGSTNAKRSVEGIGGSFDGVRGSVDKLARNAGQSLTHIAQAATIAFAAITAGATAAVKQIGNVEKSLQTLAGSIALPLQETVRLYGEAISDIVRLTGSSFRNTIVGFEKAISAGFREPAVAAQLAFRGSTAEVAGLVRTQADLIRSATTVSAALFGVNATVEQVDDAMNLLIRTAQLTDTEVAAMAPTFTTLSPIITQFGADIEELAVAQGVLSRAVRSPEQAAFGVVGIFRNLFTRTVQQRLQQQLGISSREIEDSIRQGRLFDLLGTIRDRIESQGRDVGQTLRGIIPSLYDQQAWINLLGNLSEVPGALEHVRQEGRALDEVLDNLQQSLQFNIRRIQSNFQAGLQQGFSVELNLPLDELEAFRDLSFRAGRAVGRFVGILLENLDVVRNFAAAVAAIVAALIAIKVVGIIIPIIAAVVSGFLALFTPLGLVVAAFTALVAISFSIYTAWDELKQAARSLGITIVTTFENLIVQLRAKVGQFRNFTLGLELAIRSLVERGINTVLANTERLINSIFEQLRKIPGFGDLAAVSFTEIDITSGLRRQIDRQNQEVDALLADMVDAQRRLTQARGKLVSDLGDIGTAVTDGFVGLYDGALDHINALLERVRNLQTRIFGVAQGDPTPPQAGPPGERPPRPPTPIDFQPIIRAITGSLNRGITSALNNASSLKDAAGTILTTIANTIREQAISNFARQISQIFSQLFNNVLQSLTSRLGSGFGNAISGFFANAPTLHGGGRVTGDYPGQVVPRLLEVGEVVTSRQDVAAGVGGFNNTIHQYLTGNVDRATQRAMFRGALTLESIIASNFREHRVL